MSARSKVAKAIADIEDMPVAPDSKSGATRKIPKGYVYNPKALKPLVRALYSSSIALGHALSAYREFARIKSSLISPDGQVGGQGYVLSVVDLRGTLQEACELLSKVTDTLHDEASGPPWMPASVDLDDNESEYITEMLGETDQVLGDPESVGTTAYSEVESRNDKTAASGLPNGGGVPRVKSKAPGSSNNTDGSWNTDEPPVEDAWGLKQGDQDPTAFGGEQAVVWGVSGLPTDTTPSDVMDFGLGFGGKGRGLNAPPSASSSLPDGRDLSVTRSDYFKGPALKTWASEATWGREAASELPGAEVELSEKDADLLGTSKTFEDMSQPYTPYRRELK